MISTDPIQANQYVLDSYHMRDPGKTLPSGSEDLVSIFNDTDEVIKVDFSFIYLDKLVNTARNIGHQHQITSESEVKIGARKWCHINVPKTNEFHSSKGCSITELFKLKVNNNAVYMNFKHDGKGSTGMSQNYTTIDPSKTIFFPATLKISKGQ